MKKILARTTSDEDVKKKKKREKRINGNSKI